MSLMITSCGQPLQINPTAISRPTRSATEASAPPLATATWFPATNVPGSSAGAPTGQALPTVDVAPATPMPTTTIASTAAPTSSVVVVPWTPVPRNNQERWRAQQDHRQVLSPAQPWIAKSPAPLLWYDPLTGQTLTIGTLIGEFTVQAQFMLHGTQGAALEVPYRINADYGLTAISEALRNRMHAAGYRESVEAYVMQTADVVPK